MMSKFPTVLLVALSMLSGSVSANFDPNSQESPVCYPFQCPRSQTAVPKTRFKFKSVGGCSTLGSGMMMMAGGGQNQEPYSQCCDQWHACYQTCGSFKTVCDESFFKCAEASCDATSDAAKCKEGLNLKKLLLNMGGCKNYDGAQAQACDCVDKSKAPARRTEAIRYFYKKHAPDQVAKVDGLAEKVKDSSSKTAGLFQKLVTKYPKCVAIEEDPSQKYYEDLMKNAGKDKDDEGAEEEVDDSDETQEL